MVAPMVSREEVYERVRRTMKELFEVDADRVTPDTKLIDDLGLDSIDALDLAAHLEELSPRRIPDERLKALRSVNDVVELVLLLVNDLPFDASEAANEETK